VAVEIITKEDLNEFREKLLSAIKSIMGGNTKESQKWLKILKNVGRTTLG